MRYNTGNPIGPDGSSRPEDLHDNAGNLDLAMNDRVPGWWNDRLGVKRPNIAMALQLASTGQVNTFYAPTRPAAEILAASLAPGATVWIDSDDDYDGVKTRNLVDEAHALVETVADTAAGVKWERMALSKAIATVQDALDAKGVSIWEFAHLATGYTVGGDPATWDWTPAIQGAIDAASSLYGGWSVLLPAGTFPITRIKRRRGVKLIGMGSRSTALVALPFDPADGKPYGFIEIEPGPVAGAGMQGIACYGSADAIYGNSAVNPLQWGFYCHAQYDAGNVHGGFWHSQDIDVAYWNFNYGVWSRGGYTDANSLRPNQFIDYINVQVGVQAGGIAWRFTGQHGQINLINGYGEGLNPAGFAIADTAVEITWDPDPSTTAVNGVNGESTSDVAGVGNAARCPTNIWLGRGFSLQKTRRALRVKGAARNIDLNGCWVEYAAEAITLENSAKLSVNGTRFANAANGTYGGGAGTGYVVKQAAGTSIDWGAGNEVSGTTDSFMSSASASNNDIGGYNYTSPLSITATSATLFPARGAKTQTISAAGVIDVGGHPLCLAINNADPSIRLVRIDGRQMPGQTLVIRASGGPITLRSTGNVVTGSPKDMTTPSGGCFVLQRLMPTTAGYDWVLLSASEHYATAAPADGFYYSRGHKVWNSQPSAGGTPGWVCTAEGLAGSTAVFRNMAVLS